MPSTSTRKSSSSRHSGLFGYYPFGMQMQGREFAGGMRYRWGFGAQEIMDGLRQVYAYDYRFYSSQLCRFTSIDPHFARYISFSPFQYSINCPIVYRDYDGRDIILSTALYHSQYIAIVKTIIEINGELSSSIGSVVNKMLSNTANLEVTYAQLPQFQTSDGNWHKASATTSRMPVGNVVQLTFNSDALFNVVQEQNDVFVITEPTKIDMILTALHELNHIDPVTLNVSDNSAAHEAMGSKASIDQMGLDLQKSVKALLNIDLDLETTKILAWHGLEATAAFYNWTKEDPNNLKKYNSLKSLHLTTTKRMTYAEYQKYFAEQHSKNKPTELSDGSTDHSEKERHP